MGPTPPRPTLSVTASGCDLGDTAVTCTVTLLGGGAPLRWSAMVTDPLSLSTTSGDLDPGATVTVTVTLRPATPRAPGSATVAFTGGGRTQTVRATWDGEPSPDPSSS